MSSNAETLEDDLEEQDSDVFWQRYLTFLLDGEEYALEISRVREIRTWEKATYLPLSDPFVKGVINMRGAIVPIIDLRLRFGLEEIEPTQNTTIILVQMESEDKSRLLGIVVDEVLDIHDIKQVDVQTDCDMNNKANSDCIMGMVSTGDKFLIILNQDKLLYIFDDE